MLLFLKNKNLEPIVQEEAESKKAPEPSVIGDSVIPETTDEQSKSGEQNKPSEPEAKKETRPKKPKL